MDRLARLKQLLDASPEDSFIKHAMALEYIKAGNDYEAKRLFESLLHSDENYIGSYYHLAKLLERIGEKQAAIQWYEKGMLMAKEKGDHHALNELTSAYEDLVDL
jgi:Tfp pilus assembly protein PilF